MAKTKIVMVRMKDNVRDDVTVIQEYIARITKSTPTTSDAIRTAIMVMAAEIKQKQEKSNER